MELTSNRSSLLEEIQLLQGILERRTTIPILANVLLHAEGDRLALAATDLDVTVFTSCPAQVVEEGRATINGRVFADLVRSLPSDVVKLTSREGKMEVVCASFQSKVASLDPADFPTLPEVPAGQGFAFPLALLQRLVDRTLFAVSGEEGHFQYNAALLNLGPDQVEMVATDGHRLAFVAAAHEAGPPPFAQQLLPRKVLTQLRRLDSEPETPVYLGRGDNHLAFRVGERVLLSRVLEARFPQYERVLVRDNPHRAELPRQEFTAALRRVAILASEKTHGVQLAFENGSVQLSSVGFDLGQAGEEIACIYSGPPLKVLLNATYLLDFLGAASSESVLLRLRDADAPLVIAPAEDHPSVAEWLYVIMPIRL